MKVDLNKLEGLEQSNFCNGKPVHYFANVEFHYVNLVLDSLPLMLAELRAAREVVDAARVCCSPSIHEASDVARRWELERDLKYVKFALRRLDEATGGDNDK